MTTVRDIETFLYAWAPRETAESWDNVGLLVGRGDREVRRVLAALDVTPAVAAEAGGGPDRGPSPGDERPLARAGDADPPG